METKDFYLKKMKAELDDLNYKWNIERNKIEAKAQHAKVEVKQKYEEKLKTLEKKREKMSQKLDQIDVASEDAWRDIKEGVDNAWQSLNEAIKKARSHFDQMFAPAKQMIDDVIKMVIFKLCKKNNLIPQK